MQRTPQRREAQRTGARGGQTGRRPASAPVPEPAPGPAGAFRPSADSVFNFGRWHGETYLEVLQLDASYYFWGALQPKPSPALRAFMLWVQKAYTIDDVELSLVPKDGSYDLLRSPPLDIPQAASKKEPSSRKVLYQRVAASTEPCVVPPGCT